MIEILYQDEYICAINKASGSVVYKTAGAGDSPVILQALRDQIGKKIFPVHRLDRGTSGVMVFALSSEAAALLQNSLSEAKKKYYGLCLGQPGDEGQIDRALKNEKGVEQKAITKFKKVDSFTIQNPEQIYSLLELEILTGRKHQIRRHLSYLGHHLVGDTTHGKGWLNRRFRERYDFNRLFLHCHSLRIKHPVTKQALSLNAPMASELLELLNQLENTD